MVYLKKAKLYLNNALAPVCFEKKEKSDRCVSEKTYSDIEVIDDRLGGGLALVSANNRFKQIVIAFHPTQNFQNVLDNLDAGYSDILDAPENSTVYRGFYKVYLGLKRGVQKALTKKLNDPRFKDYVVQITGYSLGGPIPIYSIPLIYSTVDSIDPTKKIEVFTYMSPRPGNIDYARYVASSGVSITRHDYGFDLVRRLPTRALGFVHVGQEIYTPYKSHKTIICSQKYDEDPECGYKFRYHLPQVNNHLRPFGTFIAFPTYY